MHRPDREQGSARTHLPVQRLLRHGLVLQVDVLGPLRVRPGDLPDPVALPLRGVAEATIVLQGEVEHRDALGHRGALGAPAVRLVAGGAGLLTEVGPSRTVRRDGGPLHVITIRWAQQRAATVPTARTAVGVPTGQGRSTITTWVGADGAVDSPDVVVRTAEVAEGAVADLPVDAQDAVMLVVLGGAVLVGEGLRPAGAGDLVVLDGAGTRVQLTTGMDGSAATVLLVTSPEPAVEPLHRDGLVVADTSDELGALHQAAATGGFGSLPGLDG